MTTYLLTAGDDNINGTENSDTFDGYIAGTVGGTDTLNGRGGDDTFLLDGSGTIGYAKGAVDGGLGIDTVALKGLTLLDVTFTNVETLDLVDFVHGGPRVYATAAQLTSFDTIVSTSGKVGRFSFNIGGPGGFINFSQLLGYGAVDVDISASTAAMQIIGTDKRDFFSGSDFSDVIRGGAGDDEFSGSGNDRLYGEEGNDKFFLTYGKGIIDGGNGIDTISGYISFYQVRNVEIVDARYSSFLTFEQIATFSTVTSSVSSNYTVKLYFQGAGGAVDLSKFVAQGHAVDISEIGVTSGYSVTGTSLNDILVGSKFDDTLRGGWWE